MNQRHALGQEGAATTLDPEQIRQRLKLPPGSNNEPSRQPPPAAAAAANEVPPRKPASPLDEAWTAAPSGDSPTPTYSSAAGQRRAGTPAEPSLRSTLKETLELPKSVLVASLFLNLLGLGLPLAMLQIYDRILPNEAMGTLALLSFGLVTIFFLEAALKVVRAHVLGWATVQAGFRSQYDAAARLLAAPSTADAKAAGDWMDGFDALGELNAFNGGNSRLILVDLPLAIVFLLMILFIGGVLALVPLCLMGLFGVLTVLRGRVFHEVLSRRAEQDNKRYDFLVECLSGIHTIKSLAMEPMMLRRFERLHKTSARASYDTIVIGNKAQTIGNLFANMTQISLVTVGALLVMQGALSIGALVCCSLLSSRLTQPVIRAIGVWSELQNVALASERCRRFDTLAPAQFATAAGALTIEGAVVLNHVSSYSPGWSRPVLDDVSLSVRPGTFIGLTGADGSGRSTLTSLITGDLVPGSGSVTVDGLSPSGRHGAALRRHIGYATATPEVFDGTILENITMFGPSSRIVAARRAAQLIGLESDIFRLPEGYDTRLAQGVSDELSSGMMQRIVIARALAISPKVLILDEANSLLDLRSDRLLIAGLKTLKGHVTTFIISSRPSMLRLADHVFEIRNGKLEETDAAPAPSETGDAHPAAAPGVA